jgi:hypothetical protein
MKSVFTLSFLIIATIGFSQKITSETSANFKKLEWLVGTWNRTNVKSGKAGYENWKKPSEFELRGMGVSMQGKDTTFVEKITILIKDNNIYYVADVRENEKPVYFKLTDISNTGFVCENPEHDFPKKISYQLQGIDLKAQISGDGKSMDYLFKKQ